jgi:hypothetical protein
VASKKQKVWEAVFSLRRAADVLEGCEGWLRLPGWDSASPCVAGFAEQGKETDAAGLRAVARAIAADGAGPDGGTDVSLASVGQLARYLADMLEQ